MPENRNLILAIGLSLAVLLAWQVLLTLVPDPLRRSVGNPHADRSKTSFELSFRTGAPTDGAPCGIGQHVFGRDR